MKSWIVSCFILLATVEIISADGKFYHADLILRIPEQRALLLYDGNEEILLLQSTYESTAGSLGWVVPLPTVPELASMKPEEADMIFQRLYSISSPAIIDLSRVINLIAIGVWIGLLTLINIYSSGKLRILMNVLLLLVTFFAVPLLMWSARPLSQDPIHVIKSEKVGIYDVQVIQSEGSQPLVKWLNQHGFHFDKNDLGSFDHYVKQKWCFVVALIRKSNRSQQEGMVAPLVTRFRTKSPVYPLALTATSRKNTHVEIFVLSSRKMDCNGKIAVEFAGETDASTLEILLKTLDAVSFLNSLQLVRQKYFLTEFTENLSPGEMSEDLYFEYAKDNKPYRKKVYFW